MTFVDERNAGAESSATACLSRTASEPFTAEESDTTLLTVSSPQDPEPECEANQYVHVLPN